MSILVRKSPQNQDYHHFMLENRISAVPPTRKALKLGGGFFCIFFAWWAHGWPSSLEEVSLVNTNIDTKSILLIVDIILPINKET